MCFVDCFIVILMASMSRTSSSCASASMGANPSTIVGVSSSLGESAVSEQQAFRGKIDLAWSHCDLISQKDGKKSMK